MRERRTSLDIIRCCAVALIVMFHFTGMLGKTDSFFYGYKNGGWGSVGSTIFFVLSGFLMRQIYGKNIQLKSFYIKRFWSIIPLQMITFLFAYIIKSIQVSDFRYGGSIYKIIYSLLGIDGYMGFYSIQTYYVIGEWFTAIIIFLYIIFPLLNNLLKKYTIQTTIVLVVLYIGNIIWKIQKISPDASVFTGTLMFGIGMLIYEYADYLKKNKKIIIVLVFCALIVIFVKLPLCPLPWKNALGISIYLILLLSIDSVNISGKYARIVRFFSERAFAVYLCHHFIMVELYSIFGHLLVSRKRILLFGCMTMVVIGCVSIMLYEIDCFIKKGVQKLYKKESIQNTKNS